MSDNLVGLLLQAVLFAGINLGLRIFLRRPLICAGSAFWFGWIFLVGGGLVAVNEGWVNIRTQSTPYIRMLFNGALTGFLLATILGVVIHKPPQKYVLLVTMSERLFEKFGKKVLLSLLLVGTIFFLQRLTTVGLGENYLSNVREVYNLRSGSMLMQLGSHLTVLMTMFIILRGVYDSYYGVNIRMLILIILCGAPLGLANGGRTFLMSYTIAYLASLLLCRSQFFRMRLVLTARETRALCALILGALSIFAIMGYLRGGYGDELNIFYAVLIWPVSTLCAMDSWVFSAVMSERTYGLNSFGWLFDFISRVGLLDISSATKTIDEAIYYFQRTNNSAAVIPRSILPDLIFDFGPGAVFFGMMTVALVLETFVNRYAGRSIFLHVLAVQCLLASFTTIQNSVVSPGFAVTIFWAGVFSIMVRRYRW